MTAPTAERYVGGVEWLSRMSASKAAVVMGYGNPRYASPLALYLQMTEPEKHVRPETDVQARGTELEAAFINLWYRKHPELVRVTEGEKTYTHTVQGYTFVATPDGEALQSTDGTTTSIGLECKTVGQGAAHHEWGIPGSDVIPMQYLIQVIFQQWVSGVRRTAVIKVGPYIDDIVTYWVDYNEALAELIIAACVRFMRCVDLRIEPPTDGAPATYEAVRRSNRNIIRDEDGEDWPVSFTLATEYTEAVQGLESAESRMNKAKCDMFKVMGNARRAVVQLPVEHGKSGRPLKRKQLVIATRQNVAGGGVSLVKPRKPVDLNVLADLAALAEAEAGA